MEINTLIIGYVSLTNTVGKKKREIRDDEYYKELFSGRDLGTLHYASHQDWQKKCDEINPILIIVLGGDYYAEQVKSYKNDALLYAIEDAGHVFYRKAEIEEKKAKHIKVLTEIEGIIKGIRDDGEEKLPSVRKFASMSYDDMYKMLIQSIIGDKEDLRQKAWSLLTDNNVHKNFIWMRAQMLMEVWQHSDGKKKEEFLCMAMDQHIENGSARKLADFTDAEGQQYHQYMFTFLNGEDMNYIRRIPHGTKGQDKYAYEAILNKYETPNGLQVMMEAGQLKQKKDEYFKSEAEKVLRVLKDWQANPAKSKKDLGVMPWREKDSVDDPLSEEEVNSLKRFLKKHDPASDFFNSTPK